MDERVARFIERNENKHWGKYRAIVADRDDPERLGRLKLRVPSLLADAATGWAWPAAPYAGADVGFFFVPKVGDLVWVEFAEGELEHPIWSGCAWAKPGEGTMRASTTSAAKAAVRRMMILLHEGSDVRHERSSRTGPVGGGRYPSASRAVKVDEPAWRAGRSLRRRRGNHR